MLGLMLAQPEEPMRIEATGDKVQKLSTVHAACSLSAGREQHHVQLGHWPMPRML